MASDYNIYPAVDSDYNFPPEVRQAIAAAPELPSEIEDPESPLRETLDTLYATVIDGGSP